MSRAFSVVSGNAPTSHLPFSPAVEANGFVFVSGQASVSDTGEIVRGTFEEEMRRSVDNLIGVLQAAGCTLADVVQTRNYVADDADLATFNRIYREYFSAPYPARTTVTNCLGAALKFEIDAIAIKSFRSN